MTHEEVIVKTQAELMSNESKWKERFEDYMSKTVANLNSITEKRKKFHKWGNLSVYYSIGQAKDASNYFDLRYEGQSVGKVCVARDGSVFLSISKMQYDNNSNVKYFDGYPAMVCTPGRYGWNSREARAFRNYFKSNPGKEGHPEHKYENLLLKELSGKSSKTKSLVNIQPVTIGNSTDLFFQMPTPLTASGSDVVYSNGHGGIDILVRRKGRLTVLELKDEYKESEGPDKVINQAIAYATFIVELCKTEARDNFWKLCGFNRKPTREEVINVAILMPDPDGISTPAFAGKQLSVPGSEMKLELNYIFFDKTTATITRSSF